MKKHKKSVLLILCFMGFQLAGLSKSAIAQSYSQIKFDLKRVPWTQLSYRIKKFSVEVNAQVQLTSLPAAEVEAALIKSPQGDPIEVLRPESTMISVYYNVDPIFLDPVKTINHVWFNPDDATALGRIRQRRGKEDYKKVYRFTQQGVFRHRREPKDQHETSKQPDKWTDVRDTFYAYDLAQLGCPNVTERTVLIYIASAAEISKSMQPLSFCVFGRRQLFHVRLKPEGLHSLKVDFIEKSSQGETRRQDEVTALKLALEVQPLASDLEKVEDFSFLGFHKNIAIFIDPVASIPIQISGIISTVGNVTIKLAEVQLR
ncbi:MAG: hypothetical protein PVF32_25710 [Desulfobacterales bacterium]|jgi:hypothetical protein